MKSSSSLSNLIQELNNLGTHCDSKIAAQGSLRTAIIEKARKLILLLQTPEEAVRNIAFSPTYSTCVKIAIDLDIFWIIASSKDITAAEVALTTGAQQEMVVRLLRVLCGIGFVCEIDKLRYGPNDVTRTMTVPSTAASIIHFFDQGFPSLASLPQYFKHCGYASPDDYLNGPFQFGHKTDMESYSYWSTQPDVVNNFDTFMNGGKLGNQRRWTEWFPTTEVITKDFDCATGAVMLVDVAGGRGHDIAAFRKKHKSCTGRLILQDLPETIQGIEQLHPTIERIGHNFFERQPITGARAYFVQDIFHNWPTSVAKTILRNLAEAMTPGYSKLLISELVLPDRDCPLAMAGLDLGMMYLHSGLERSEQQWRDLLASEGLKIVQIHFEPTGDGAIIETVIDERPLGEITTYGLRHFSSYAIQERS